MALLKLFRKLGKLFPLVGEQIVYLPARLTLLLLLLLLLHLPPRPSKLSFLAVSLSAAYYFEQSGREIQLAVAQWLQIARKETAINLQVDGRAVEGAQSI